VARFQLRFGVEEDYYSALTAFAPDITVVFRGEFMPPAVIERLPGVRIAISTEPMPKWLDEQWNYTSDSLRRFEKFLKVFERKFDYVFHYDDTSARFFDAQGVRVSGFLPLPIATATYRPLGGPKTRQIFFLGRSTDHREKILGRLKMDFDVLHLAHGWPGEGPRQIDAFLRCLDPFQLCLNIHAEDEISWEPRVQHMLACRCALISEPISPNPYVRPGEHFWEAAGPEAIYRACARLLSNAEEASELAGRGYERVTETLSARRRWPELFQQVLSGGFVPAAFERNKLDLAPFRADPKSSPGETDPGGAKGPDRPKWARLADWWRR